MKQQPLRLLVIGGDPSVWLGLSSHLGPRASEVFVPPEVRLDGLASNAQQLDVILVVTGPSDIDPCAPLRMLRAAGLARRAVVLAAKDDQRTATEAVALGAGGYLVQGADLARIGSAISIVAEGGVFFEARAADSVGSGALSVAADRMSAARALAYALELKDNYTGGHAERVASLAMSLARAAGLEDAVPDESLEAAFLLHDVGKIGIPESILGKPGTLTDTERRVLQTHPILGERIVSPLGFPNCVAQVVRSHHERWDGKGYPDGLRGTDIPVAARIFSIADVIDAMTSFRPYRHPLTLEEAMREILRNAGTQFDPALSALAERIFLGATIDVLEQAPAEI